MFWIIRIVLLFSLLLSATGLAKGSNKKFTIRPYVSSSTLSVTAGPTPEYEVTTTSDVEPTPPEVKPTPPSLTEDVRTEGSDDHLEPVDVIYATNSQMEAGATFSWLGYSVSVGTPVETVQTDTDNKGETTGEDYRLFYHADWISIEAFYKNLKGFYVSNPTAIDSAWTDARPYPQHPDMELLTAGAHLTFVMSPKNFSLAALFDQSEVQKKSGGSFLLTLSGSTLSLKAGKILIHPYQKDLFPSDSQMTKIDSKEATAKVGGGYTLVWGSAYLGGAVLGGMTYYTATQNASNTDVSGNAIAGGFMVGAGINSKKIFTGISIVSSANDVMFRDVKFMVSRVNAEYFVGWRF